MADDIDQSITPYEYAPVVFKMIADFLLSNFRKFDKETLDRLILQMDKNYIEIFGFPASFEDQQNSLNDSILQVIPLSEVYRWVDINKWLTINPKAEYLNHYPF